MTRTIFIALNEFNRDLLAEVAQKYYLKNIKRALELNEYETHTPDTLDSGFLEPWSQWVTVHTGVRAQTHGIKHLGDVPNLSNPQIWEELSKNGVTSGIWGSLNASRGSADKCLFFLPDPWTFSEHGHPFELNQLLDFPRFMAKNRVSFFKLEALKNLFKFFIFFAKRPSFWFYLARYAPRAALETLIYREPFAAFAFTEVMSTISFLDFKKRFNPDFSMIFLNSIAHIQHYHWQKQKVSTNRRFKYVFALMDRALALIFESIKDEDTVIIANALSQKNTNDEKPIIGYRITDYDTFLKAIDIKTVKVEALMTMDAHLFFSTSEECECAHQILTSAKIENTNLFFVEKDVHNIKKLFFRTGFSGSLSKDAQFKICDRTFLFSKWFSTLGWQSGKHQQTGIVYSNLKLPHKSFENKDIFNLVLRQFGISNVRNAS